MGPLLLSRILSLNEIQSGVLSITFKIGTTTVGYSSISKTCAPWPSLWGTMPSSSRPSTATSPPASIGAIQRNLLTLEEQGADKYFGEPALNIEDLMQTGSKGKGMINILTADKLMQSPEFTLPSSSGCFRNCLNSFLK